MRILALDTSGRGGSLALLNGGLLVQELSGEHEYSSRLVPAIESLLRDADCPRQALDALAVAVGPGAFTGLRVGIATAQGLALALTRPCVGVNTFEAHAAQHADEPSLAVALDAFRGELLWALFEHGRALGAPRVATLAACAEALPEGVVLVGDGAHAHGAALAALRPDLRLLPPAPLAGSIALLGRKALEQGASGAAAELRPLYLRPAYVTRP